MVRNGRPTTPPTTTQPRHYLMSHPQRKSTDAENVRVREKHTGEGALTAPWDHQLASGPPMIMEDTLLTPTKEKQRGAI